MTTWCVGRIWWLALVVAGLAGCLGTFVISARQEIGPLRPVGTVCDFEHDPGSGPSAKGKVEHRGWLIRREACVHATDGENVESLTLQPFLASWFGGAAATGLVALIGYHTRSQRPASPTRTRTRTRTADRRPPPGDADG